MRMRDTTNGYLDKLAVPEWKDSFKLTSVKALVKRMTDSEPKVRGTQNMQLITAYRLLKKRLDATVAIRKECGRYLEDGTHAANALDHLEAHCDIVSPYLKHTGVSFTEQIGLLLVRSIFKGQMKANSSVHAALEGISVEAEDLVKMNSRTFENGTINTYSPTEARCRTHEFLADLIDPYLQRMLSNMTAGGDSWSLDVGGYAGDLEALDSSPLTHLS